MEQAPINRLYHTTRGVGSVPCAGEHVNGNPPNITSPAGAIAYCPRHRNNRDPAAGWMWVERQEWEIIVLLRSQGMTPETLRALRDELEQTAIINRTEQLAIEEQD